MTTETSIYEYAKQGMLASAGKTALSFLGKDISFATLLKHVDRVAEGLYGLGVREKTVVTVHLPNCPQAVITIYAVAKLGGICNMVHALTPKTGVEDAMRIADSKFLITHVIDMDLPGTKVIFADLSSHMGVVSKFGYRLKHKRKLPAGMCAFEALETASLPEAEFPEASELADCCAFYLHSSGSTGKPKTIMLSHGAVNNCVANTEDFFENGDMDRQVSLGVLPLFHGFGLAMDVHRNVSFGSKLILMPRWNAAQAVRLIKKHGVTLIVGVPTMYYALLKEPKFCGKGIRSLSKCFVGGDNVDPQLIHKFNARVGKEKCLYVGFGLTEATTANCVNTYCHYKDGSSGYPVRNTTVAVMDDSDELRYTGEGELVISSKALMMGYLNDPAATEKTLFFRNGKLWTRTGDRVWIDEDGFVFFCSRVKNIIIRNGYNIYPEQVEDVVKKIPGVLDVCVVGVSDESLKTQIIRAVVIPAAGYETHLLERKIKQGCMAQLPRFSVPQQIVFAQSFPQNAMGKIDRKELSLP